MLHGSWRVISPKSTFGKNLRADFHSRAQFWCSSELTAREVPKILSHTLELPMLENKTVRIGEVDLSFSSVEPVNRLRSIFSSAMNVCKMQRFEFGLDREKSGIESYGKISLIDALNRGLVASPILYPSVEFNEQRTANDVEVGSAFIVREMVVGVSDNKIQDVQAEFKSSDLMSSTKFPNIFKMAPHGCFVRVIPSESSSIILEARTTDTFDAFVQKLGRKSELQLVPIGRNGASYGDFKLVFPDVHGLDIRLTKSYDLKGHFYEAPESTETDSTDFGGRADMGGMSCSSVVGMEFKDRLFKDPFRLLRDVTQRK